MYFLKYLQEHIGYSHWCCMAQVLVTTGGRHLLYYSQVVRASFLIFLFFLTMFLFILMSACLSGGWPFIGQRGHHCSIQSLVCSVLSSAGLHPINLGISVSLACLTAKLITDHTHTYTPSPGRLVWRFYHSWLLSPCFLILSFFWFQAIPLGQSVPLLVQLQLNSSKLWNLSVTPVRWG